MHRKIAHFHHLAKMKCIPTFKEGMLSIFKRHPTLIYISLYDAILSDIKFFSVFLFLNLLIP